MNSKEIKMEIVFIGLFVLAFLPLIIAMLEEFFYF